MYCNTQMLKAGQSQEGMNEVIVVTMHHSIVGLHKPLILFLKTLPVCFNNSESRMYYHVIWEYCDCWNEDREIQPSSFCKCKISSSYL